MKRHINENGLEQCVSSDAVETVSLPFGAVQQLRIIMKRESQVHGNARCMGRTCTERICPVDRGCILYNSTV